MNTTARQQPFASIEADLLDEWTVLDRENDTFTPREVAEEFWRKVHHWCTTGYLPTVDVTMPDGTTYTIDLESRASEYNTAEATASPHTTE